MSDNDDDTWRDHCSHDHDLDLKEAVCAARTLYQAVQDLTVLVDEAREVARKLMDCYLRVATPDPELLHIVANWPK